MSEAKSQIIIRKPQLCPVVTGDYAFYLVEDEPAVFHLNGDTVEVKPGDGLFVNENQIFSQDRSVKCLCVDPEFWRERNHWKSRMVDFIQEQQIQPYLVLHAGETSERAILDGVKILDRISQKAPATYPILSGGIIYSMFQALIQQIDARCELDFPKDDEERCKDLMKYCDTHYGERITLEDMAEYLEVTPNTCNRTLKRYTGYTSVDYLTRLRMNKACEQMRSSPKKKIVQIAREVGIPDKSYFTAIFKKLMGMTPMQYKKEILPTD